MMSIANNKEWSWWRSVQSSILEDFRLRRTLMPLRKADFSTKIKSEDKLLIKPTLFASAFLLFNASLIVLYLSFKKRESMKSYLAPTLFLGFTFLAYKLELEWTSREIIRKCELSSSDVAYFMRKKLLEECSEHPFIKNRVKIFENKNRDYQKIYEI